MPLNDIGPTTYNDSLPVIKQDIFGIAVNWFVNRTPVLSRFPKLPVGSPSFKITNDGFRPRSGSVNNGAATGTGTTFTVADGSALDVGDVILIESELILVTGIAGNVLTVVRGYGNTTAATHADLIAYSLITNTRTGAEVDITAMSRIPAPTTQWCQTVQHAYQVGGALEETTNYVSGLGGPLDRDRMLAMQHCFDDFESACYFGTAVGVTASGSRPMMGGLKNLIATNKTTSPTNASAYKPSDLIRDTVQKCFNSGGNPAYLIVSPDFLTGLAVWGNAAMRVQAGSSVFGTAIDLFEVPFLSGMSIIPAPLLGTGTAICVSAAELRIRMKRPLRDKPRGSRGDAFEGDLIMEGAVELDNEAHHAWVSGVTAFAAS